jgi:hypothetical protein
MPLAPIKPEATQQPNIGDAGTQQAQPTSFRERKLAALSSESEPAPGRPEDLNAESAEDGYPDDDGQDLQPTGDAGDDYEDDEDTAGDPDDGEDGALFEDEELSLDDESEEAEEDPAENTVEFWQDKAQNLERELSRVTANRKAIEQEFTDGIQGNITLRHSLEDLNNEAETRATFFLNMANHTVTQYENLDWNAVPPEQMAQTKAAYQRAVTQRDQVVQAFNQVKTAKEQDRETAKRREAEISRSVLSRRIPNWSNDHYVTLREHAKVVGYTPEEFNEMTDWRPILLIHQDWERQQATQKVRKLKREPKAARSPRNRNARLPERNTKGRFKKARDEAFSRPGDKGSFHEMKRRQLENERKTGGR